MSNLRIAVIGGGISGAYLFRSLCGLGLAFVDLYDQDSDNDDNDDNDDNNNDNNDDNDDNNNDDKTHSPPSLTESIWNNNL